MFSSTAYEAFYTYIGIYLHEASIQIITAQEVLVGLLMLILGGTFLMGAWKYFSRYFPGFLGAGGGANIGVFFKIIACFLIAVTILKVDAPARIKNFKRVSWHTNPYIESKLPSIEESYKVSFVFDLLTRSAEEIAGFANHIVDKLFRKTNSELDAPAAFYRAILYSGSLTIDDPALKDKIDVYTNNCFDKVLPLLGTAKKKDKLDEFFKQGGMIDSELDLIPIEMEGGHKITCLDLKNEVRDHLHQYAFSKQRHLEGYSNYLESYRYYNKEIARNVTASSGLVNHYLKKSEDLLGTQEGSKVSGTFAKFLLGWNRFWSFDGFLTLIGQREQVGAALTAKRAEQFSEYLQRAPHIKGMVKMFLIAIFPWLVFFIVAGKWKILISWYAVYISVLMWTPIWTLLYHLMTSIALSTETMQEFGKLSDGISLYSSSFINAKLYQFYAIYSWLQIIVGPLPTLILGYGMFSSFLKDSEGESTPQPVAVAKDVGVTAATGGSTTSIAKRL